MRSWLRGALADRLNTGLAGAPSAGSFYPENANERSDGEAMTSEAEQNPVPIEDADPEASEAQQSEASEANAPAPLETNEDGSVVHPDPGGATGEVEEPKDDRPRNEDGSIIYPQPSEAEESEAADEE